MANKSIDSKRRAHAAKVLQKMNKPGRTSDSESSRKSKLDSSTKALREQYNVIREDIIKLKDDLSKGYGMAKNLMEKRGIVKEFFKTR